MSWSRMKPSIVAEVDEVLCVSTKTIAWATLPGTCAAPKRASTTRSSPGAIPVRVIVLPTTEPVDGSYRVTSTSTLAPVPLASVLWTPSEDWIAPAWALGAGTVSRAVPTTVAVADSKNSEGTTPQPTVPRSGSTSETRLYVFAETVPSQPCAEGRSRNVTSSVPKESATADCGSFPSEPR